MADVETGLAAASPPAPAARPVEKPARPANRTTAWLTFALPALAELVVGGYRIGDPSLWRDEASTISGSERSVGQIFAMMWHIDAVHIPYYLIMHVVIAIGGISAVSLRIPSLVAMAAAVGLTAETGRRLASTSRLPAPRLVGIVAGLALISVPQTTRYAQMARPYALATLCAVAATYLFLRAVESSQGDSDHRISYWRIDRWWLSYAIAVVLTGMFNLFAIVIVGTHALSLLIAKDRQRGGRSRHARVIMRTSPVADSVIFRWFSASVLAAILLAPMALLSISQSGQVSWLTTPNLCVATASAHDFSGGSNQLMPVIGTLALLGCFAGLGLRLGKGLTLAVVALPWFVLPPLFFYLVSYVRPVFLERYILFCLPALSLLVAGGLAGLYTLARSLLGQVRATRRVGTILAALPPLVLAAIIGALVYTPQHNARLRGSTVDNIRAVSQVLAKYERPGDSILYMPWSTAILQMAYPGPFERLRAIDAGAGPTATASMTGNSASPQVVVARLHTVSRVWTIQWAPPHPSCVNPPPPTAPTPVDVVMNQAVGKMHLLRRWYFPTMILSLYDASPPIR
ncbi:MAG: glycosyltransferase family 39 protein [Streptosporangiaceae bacterium]